jgi:co-chaperonin GroES (HSP10)
MTILPNNNMLLIKKHEKMHLKSDIDIPEDDGDKRLITGDVISSNEPSFIGKIVVFGKYATLKLTIKGEDFFFVDNGDVVALIDKIE